MKKFAFKSLRFRCKKMIIRIEQVKVCFSPAPNKKKMTEEKFHNGGIWFSVTYYLCFSVKTLCFSIKQKSSLVPDREQLEFNAA